MFKRIIIFLFIFQSTYSQVTFIVDDIPKTTPKFSGIYISEDFENWTGGQEKYKLNKTEKGYMITIQQAPKTINFKFTQGSWDTVETDENGNTIENRNYSFKTKNDTIRIAIQNWSNSASKRSTATKNVSILSEDFYMPQLNRKRRIWVYLPPDYHQSKKKYPVIYMHDGQNLFDEKTSFSGEWQVDETLNKIFDETGKEFIVIGIDNGGDKRLDEYSPWENNKYGGGEGDKYIDFIVETLKPFVDQNYRTKSGKSNTAIFGSSMGGLISFYATLKYSQVFGKSGVFSPSFWFSDESFDYAKTYGNLKNTKMYLLAGNKEGEEVAFNEISKTVADMQKMGGLLKTAGFNSNNINTKVIPKGKHNEKMWRGNFKEAVLWLFSP